MTATTFQFVWQDRTVQKMFKSGVSLHSHTMYSEESLEMIPRHTAKVPYLGSAIRRHEAEYLQAKGDHLDFRRAFWTPPLAPRQAHRLEQKQIEDQFQLPGLVSLTDHDDIRAGSMLRVLSAFREAPVSTEWTIPFGPTFFHLGVHNMPPEDSHEIMRQFSEFTGNPEEHRLQPLLSMLNSYPDVLLVLNHPLWDEKGIGVAEHALVVGCLLERYGSFMHALELNGLRSWCENKQVIRLGRQIEMPLVSGGDRHGLEPNATVNLSRTDTLPGFIHELRYEKVSHVAFMPQYHEPIKVRLLHTMVDVVREYPENFEGRRTWGDRVFYHGAKDQMPIPLSSYWKDGGPKVVKHFIAAMRLLELRTVRSALRLALNDRASVWSDQGALI